MAQIVTLRAGHAAKLWQHLDTLRAERGLEEDMETEREQALQWQEQQANATDSTTGGLEEKEQDTRCTQRRGG
jgi:hypothetical protein